MEDSEVLQSRQAAQDVMIGRSDNDDEDDDELGIDLYTPSIDINGSVPSMPSGSADMFCTGKVRLQAARERARVLGQPIVKHRNGKVDLGALLDDPNSREFVCPYCSFSFAYKHVLERHVMQIHEKHKLETFQCPKCPYSTVRKDQMRSHFSVVHEDYKPYSCSECNFRAPKGFRVTSHIEKSHGGIGAVIHNADLKPKSVSPPPPEVLKAALEAAQFKRGPTLWGTSSNPVPIMNMPDMPLPQDNNSDSNEDDDAFVCPHCDFTAGTQIDMGEHVMTNHRVEQVAKEKGLVKLEDIAAAQATLPLETAGGSVITANQRVMVVTKAKNPLHQCSLCLRQYQTPIRLKMHVRKEHPDVIIFDE